MSVYMIGLTVGSMHNMGAERMRLKEQNLDLNTAVRVSQNEKVHAILRNMNFHLSTRQMTVWDQNVR